MLEALRDSRVTVARVVLARSAQGDAVDDIVREAGVRSVAIERAEPAKVTRLSGNGRHDQGVVAHVRAPGLGELADWLEARRSGAVSLFVLDGVTNPSNVGMIIRSATAAGLDGTVLPRAGCPDVGPLVVKASAGVALGATILRAPTAAAAARHLRGAGVTIVGLRATEADPLWDIDLPTRCAFVVGNETSGISAPVADTIGCWCAIPLAGGVESLNVASAATVVAFEVARRSQARN